MPDRMSALRPYQIIWCVKPISDRISPVRPISEWHVLRLYQTEYHLLGIYESQCHVFSLYQSPNRSVHCRVHNSLHLHKQTSVQFSCTIILLLQRISGPERKEIREYWRKRHDVERQSGNSERMKWVVHEADFGKEWSSGALSDVLRAAIRGTDCIHKTVTTAVLSLS